MAEVKIDPANIDQGIANLKDELVAIARTAPGYAGAALLIDGETGEGGRVNYWESLADMNAAVKVRNLARFREGETTASEVIDVDRFELTLGGRRLLLFSLRRRGSGGASLPTQDRVASR